MNRKILIKIALLIGFFAFCLYSYIDRQNQLTLCKMEIFDLAKDIDTIKEKNSRLMYEIEQFENPAHLLQLAKSAEFSHLKHPLVEQVLSMPDRVAAKDKAKKSTNLKKSLAAAK